MPVKCQLFWKPKDSLVFYTRQGVDVEITEDWLVHLDQALPIFIDFLYESEQVKNPLGFSAKNGDKGPYFTRLL